MTLAVLRCLLVARRRRSATRCPMHSTATALPGAADGAVVSVEGRPALLLDGERGRLRRRSPTCSARAGRGRPRGAGTAVVLAHRGGPARVRRGRARRPARRRGQGPRPRSLPRLAARGRAPASSPTAAIMLVLDPDGLDRGRPRRAAPDAARRRAPAPAPPARRGCSWSTTRSPSASSSARSSSAPGYEVATAADGAAALRALGERPADLVLTDVEMPGMDGFALTRGDPRRPALASMPVLILTSRGRRRGPAPRAWRRAPTPTWSRATSTQRALLDGGAAAARRGCARRERPRRVRLVLVEDSATQRAHLARVLQADGDIVVVAEVADADAAVAAVARQRPDVVTMDLDLPGSGGQDAIARIMAETPTPILVLSGLIDGVGRRPAVAALAAGAVDALPKPARWDEEAERRLRRQVRTVAAVPVVGPPPAGARRRRRGRRARARGGPVVGIAASTGGPAALAALLRALPAAPRAHPASSSTSTPLHRGLRDLAGRRGRRAPVETADARRDARCPAASMSRRARCTCGSAAAAGWRSTPSRRRPPPVRRRALRSRSPSARGQRRHRRLAHRHGRRRRPRPAGHAPRRRADVRPGRGELRRVRHAARGATGSARSSGCCRPSNAWRRPSAGTRCATRCAHDRRRQARRARRRAGRAAACSPTASGCASRARCAAGCSARCATARPRAASRRRPTCTALLARAGGAAGPARRHHRAGERASSATRRTSTCWCGARCPRLPGAGVVWSAGCANGQEAWSLAMALEEAGAGDWRVLATDVSSAALTRAEAGRYSEREVAGLSAARRARFLRRAARAAGRSGRACAAACPRPRPQPGRGSAARTRRAPAASSSAATC